MKLCQRAVEIMNQWFAPKPDVLWDQTIFESANVSTARDTGKVIHDQSRSPRKKSTKDRNGNRCKLQIPAAPTAQLLKPAHSLRASPVPFFPTAVKESNSLRASPVPFPTAVKINIRPSTPVNSVVRRHLGIHASSEWLTLSAGIKQ